MKTPELLVQLRSDIQGCPQADLPAIIGQMEALKAAALARLVGSDSAPQMPIEEGDHLLTVAETAKLLNQSPRWVRDHQRELPRVNLPGRSVRFSERRLTIWLRRRSYT